MKMLAGIALAVLSMVGMVHQNTVVKPPLVAISFPKAIHLSAITPPVVIASTAKPSKTLATVSRPITAGIVLGASTSDGVVTPSQLQAAIDQASNALRQLIYADAGTVGKGLYSTGGYTNNIALSQRIDTLSNVTIANPTVTGTVSGLTAASIPALSSLNGLLAIAQGGTGTSTLPAANRLLLSDANGNWEYISSSTLGIVSGVSTVSNADGTLIITPTNGNVVASLNLANANTWSGTQTFANLITTNATTSNLVAQQATTTHLVISSVASALLKTNANGTVEPAVAGADYLNTAITSIGPIGQLQNGAAQTFATSTFSLNGLTAGLTIVGSGNTQTFTPTLTGILSYQGGGTGIAAPTAAGVVLGNYAGTGYQQLATSSLGILTTDVAEGTNLYWTPARFDTRLSATTSLPNITTLAHLSSISTSLTGILRATTGAITTSLINLASDVTGILPTANGGTGVAAIASGFIPFGNGTGAIATSSSLYFDTSVRLIVEQLQLVS